MARPSLLKLDHRQRLELIRAAAASADPDFRDACRAVLALAEGQLRVAVAATFNVHPATVGRWSLAYRRQGLGGLAAPVEDRRGRPPKLKTEDLQWLQRVVLSSPPSLGFAFTAWNLPRLASYLEQERGLRVQAHYLGHLLRRMGLRRRRPAHTLKGKRDEAAHKQAKAELQRIKRNLKRTQRVVISQDEAEFHLFPYLVAVWCVVGSPQVRIPTPGKNQKRVLYGGLDLKSGRLVSHWATSKSSAHFIEYLKVLLRSYPRRTILLITDNGSFHHTKAVDQFLEENRSRLEVKWLPPYCPDLNDIERTWRQLKGSHASNFLFNSLDELAANVQRGIEEMNAAARK